MKRIKAPDWQHHALIRKGLRLVEVSRRHAFAGEFQVDLTIRSMTIFRTTTPQHACDGDWQQWIHP
jgi:hypothetical protein